MHKTKQIVIILPDTLQMTGLYCLLAEYFPPVEISCFASFEEFASAGTDNVDFYFTQSDLFVLNADYFLPRRSKVIIVLCADSATGSDGCYLHTHAPQETIIEQLQQLFDTEHANIGEKSKDLSAREVEVLQLIVKGCTNKDIADKLIISLNTVLSHRKNITAKLGIKTVSGLTFYAIMNGIVSSDFLN